MSRTLLLLFSALCAPCSFASDFASDSAYIELGTGDGTRVVIAGAQRLWATNWRPFAGTELLVLAELSAGRWRSKIKSPQPDTAYHTYVGATPGVRLASASPRGWYVEGAVGASYIRPLFRTDGRRFSTRWNFRDQFAIGYVIDRSDFSIRVEHYSNADLREPNPGATFFIARYGYRF